MNATATLQESFAEVKSFRDMKELVSKLTFGTVSSTGMGVRVNADKIPEHYHTAAKLAGLSDAVRLHDQMKKAEKVAQEVVERAGLKGVPTQEQLKELTEQAKKHSDFRAAVDDAKTRNGWVPVAKLLGGVGAVAGGLTVGAVTLVVQAAKLVVGKNTVGNLLSKTALGITGGAAAAAAALAAVPALGGASRANYNSKRAKAMHELIATAVERTAYKATETAAAQSPAVPAPAAEAAATPTPAVAAPTPAASTPAPAVAPVPAPAVASAPAPAEASVTAPSVAAGGATATMLAAGIARSASAASPTTPTVPAAAVPAGNPMLNTMSADIKETRAAAEAAKPATSDAINKATASSASQSRPGVTVHTQKPDAAAAQQQARAAAALRQQQALADQQRAQAAKQATITNTAAEAVVTAAKTAVKKAPVAGPKELAGALAMQAMAGLLSGGTSASAPSASNLKPTEETNKTATRQ